MRYIRPPRPRPGTPCFAPPVAPRRILLATPPEAITTPFAATPVALTRVGVSPRAGHLCTRCAPPRGTRRRARSAPTTPDFPCDGGPSITHLLPPPLAPITSAYPPFSVFTISPPAPSPPWNGATRPACVCQVPIVCVQSIQCVDLIKLPLSLVCRCVRVLEELLEY